MITVEKEKKSSVAFEHNLKQLIAMTKEPVEDILKQQGKLFALAAAKSTSRYGNKKNIGKRRKSATKDQPLIENDGLSPLKRK